MNAAKVVDFQRAWQLLCGRAAAARQLRHACTAPTTVNRESQNENTTDKLSPSHRCAEDGAAAFRRECDAAAAAAVGEAARLLRVRPPSSFDAEEPSCFARLGCGASSMAALSPDASRSAVRLYDAEEEGVKSDIEVQYGGRRGKQGAGGGGADDEGRTDGRRLKRMEERR